MSKVLIDDNLITPDELASILRMSKSSIYRIIERREIPFYKISGSLRFKKSDVENYINNSLINAITK
ncbi:MAG: helix-turn-helix domain-containing protein [Patescibacteria group bacterium]